MTPTKTLLSQLRETVGRMANLCDDPELKISFPVFGTIVKGHLKACEDIIKELEGRDRRSGWQEPLFHTAMKENSRRIQEARAMQADLRHLHDLIKGSAPREAMELLRQMIGEK